jgi:hypothetical protein
MPVKIEDVYPLETVVRKKSTGEFAIIKEQTFLKDKAFLHYLGWIEGKGEHLYYLNHDDLDVECWPEGYQKI